MSVSVVGAGPAGCIASILLARGGEKVTLYEKDWNGSKPCGGLLTTKVKKHFSEFIQDIPVNRIEKLKLDFNGIIKNLRFSRPVLYVVNRDEFDKNLKKMVLNENNIRVINANQDIRTLNDDYVIDARGYVHESDRNKWIALRGFCKNVGYDTPCFFFRRNLIKCGYFWIIPMPDGNLNVGGGGKLKDYKTSPAFLVKGFFKTIGLDVNSLKAAPVDGDGKIKKPIEGKIIRIGESAGLVNPLIGEGIYHAMESGRVLAECILNDCVDQYEKIIIGKFSKEFEYSRRVRYFLANGPIFLFKPLFKRNLKKTLSYFTGVVV